MNIVQRLILGICVLYIILLSLFPPRIQTNGRLTKYMGRSFIASEPPKEGLIVAHERHFYHVATVAIFILLVTRLFKGNAPIKKGPV